jgi:hypothetical protein
MSEQPRFESIRNGWIVEALVPKLNAAEPSQMVFAASIEDPDAAVDAVRRAVGGLRCDIEARMRLTPRALAQLALRPGEVKSL